MQTKVNAQQDALVSCLNYRIKNNKKLVSRTDENEDQLEVSYLASGSIECYTHIVEEMGLLLKSLYIISQSHVWSLRELIMCTSICIQIPTNAFLKFLNHRTNICMDHTNKK